jgi:hypothetical protein
MFQKRIWLACALGLLALIAAPAAIAAPATPTRWVNDDKPVVSAPGQNCGKPGYNTIQAAVTAASPGDVIAVCSGTYVESNITIDKALTIDGQGNPRIVPEGEDGNFNSATLAPIQNGFIVRSNGVTIQNLTIDGEGNPALTPGKNNYRTAIITDPALLAPSFNNTVVRDTEITHVYRRGIQLRGGSGHVLDHNKITDVTLLDGIVVFEADTTITNNDIREAVEGIGTNYLTVPANAPLVTITGNHISKAPDFGVGMNLSGLADGSLIDSNDIDMKNGGADEIGIVVQYAVGTVTVSNNKITGSDGDSGMWLYHNEDPLHPVMVTSNKIDGHQTADEGAGSATGIFITDDGDFFGDEDGSSYAVVQFNTIRHWVRGIHEQRNKGRVVDTTANQNCIEKNSAYGALVDGLTAGPPNMDATNNWWGDKNGPSGVGPGNGDAVSTFVDYSPWATKKNCKD